MMDIYLVSDLITQFHKEYIASNNISYTSPKHSASVAQGIAQALQVEQCKRYIVDNRDFPGFKHKACKGIQEDDSRLNGAYSTMFYLNALESLNH